MGLLGDILFDLIMSSDTKLGDAVRKSADFFIEEDITAKRKALSLAKEKAYESGNKELVEKIREEEKKYL